MLTKKQASQRICQAAAEADFAAKEATISSAMRTNLTLHSSALGKQLSASAGVAASY
jgi:hypothetical protein